MRPDLQRAARLRQEEAPALVEKESTERRFLEGAPKPCVLVRDHLRALPRLVSLRYPYEGLRKRLCQQRALADHAMQDMPRRAYADKPERSCIGKRLAVRNASDPSTRLDSDVVVGAGDFGEIRSVILVFWPLDRKGVAAAVG